MAIESVGSSSATLVSQQTRQAPEAREAERPAPPREQRAEGGEEPRQPQPVKNAEGQVTGTRVNVTA